MSTIVEENDGVLQEEPPISVDLSPSDVYVPVVGDDNINDFVDIGLDELQGFFAQRVEQEIAMILYPIGSANSTALDVILQKAKDKLKSLKEEAQKCLRDILDQAIRKLENSIADVADKIQDGITEHEKKIIKEIQKIVTEQLSRLPHETDDPEFFKKIKNIIKKYQDQIKAQGVLATPHIKEFLHYFDSQYEAYSKKLAELSNSAFMKFNINSSKIYNSIVGTIVQGMNGVIGKKILAMLSDSYNKKYVFSKEDALVIRAYKLYHQGKISAEQFIATKKYHSNADKVIELYKKI